VDERERNAPFAPNGGVGAIPVLPAVLLRSVLTERLPRVRRSMRVRRDPNHRVGFERSHRVEGDPNHRVGFERGHRVKRAIRIIV